MSAKPKDGALQRIVEAFTSGEFEAVRELVQQGLGKGVQPSSLMDDGLIPGIREVGEQFRRGEVFLPEMMMAAEAWQEGMAVIEPLMAAQGIKGKPVGTVVIGSVKGDIHSLGKNIVVAMLKTANFQVIDLGVDVPASRFVDEAEKHSADVIALSALMTTTMPQQREVIEHLMARAQRDKYFVMVGGGPTNADWAKEIGADGYGETAADAVAMALSQVEKRGAAA